MYSVSEYRGDRKYRQSGIYRVVYTEHIRCVEGAHGIEGTPGRGTQWAVNSEDRSAPSGGLGMAEHRVKAVPRA